MARLAVYQPEIAQNLGSMIRTCACFGAEIHVIGPCGFPFSARALRRSAMDYADLAALTTHVDWTAFQSDRPPGRLVLMTTRSDRPLWSHSFGADDVLMVGQESAGVPAAVHAAADVTLRIPQPGGGRSLNVAVAAAIALAEAARQAAAPHRAVTSA